MIEISKELDDAICMLFEQPEVGYNALGFDQSEALKSIGLTKEKDVLDNVSVEEKIAFLRRKLENWVELKSLEIQEFEDPEDITRIRSEALSTLMVLRDLSQYFPAVQTATREEFDRHKRQL